MHSKSLLRQLRLLTLIVPFIVLPGCFGTGDGKDPVPGILQTALGKVVFSNVSGVTYKTLIPNGVTEIPEGVVTDPDGEYIEDVTGPDSEFIYYPGEMVTFAIGDIENGIVLGTVPGTPRITAVQLTGSKPTDLRALRLMRFIQSLDLDQFHSNGITIANPSRANGLTLDFNAEESVFEARLLEVVRIITGDANKTVISADAARDNFCYSFLIGGGQDIFGFTFEGCALGPDEELLQNRSFEEPVGGSACSNRWTCFNDALTVDNNAPDAFDENQVLKIFGPFFPEGGAGAYQEFTPVPGSEYTASVQAQNWSGESIDDSNIAIMQLVFSNDGNWNDDGKGETAFEVSASGAFGTERTYLQPNIWTELKRTAKAPLDSVAARFVLLHVQLASPPAGGSIFYDQASVIGPTLEPPSVEYELVWFDEFDTPVLNESFWNIEDGYGVWSDPFGNNEWQRYTGLEENIRIVTEDAEDNFDPENDDPNNGYLQITALCKDPLSGATATGATTSFSAAVATYSQDFEALNATDPDALGLLGDGYKLFADVWLGDVGTGTFLYGYGPFTAPNGGPGFSAIATNGEGGPPQGSQYLNIYSDYNNADQTSGGSCGTSGCTINTSVFQEQTIEAGDIGSTVTLSFDAKSPFEGGIFDATQPVTEANAFIVTLDPGAGFAATNDVRVDMTNISNTDWNTFSISLDLADPLLEGQLLQFGFNTVTTEYDATGVYYDNISFTGSTTEPPDCIAGNKDDSVTSARINTLNTAAPPIRYGKIVGRIKPPVGKAAWPAFWMLGTNEPDIGWPKSGEIDITEIWTSGVGGSGNNRTTHSTLHWCPYSDADEETIGNCFAERVFEGGSLDTGSSLGNDFHEFEAVWDPDRIVFYLDGEQVWSRSIDPVTMEEFNNDFYLILNLAMGGTLGSANQDPDPNGANWELPQRMLVDYVRVYKAIAP